MEVFSPNVLPQQGQQENAGNPSTNSNTLNGPNNSSSNSGSSSVNSTTTTNSNNTTNTNSSSVASLFTSAMEKTQNERPPTWQLDLTMEKLRQKSNQLKPLAEISKNIRMTLAERRCFLDQSDRLHLQKCLDSLQQNIKVNSLQSMVERLEMVSRQLGLKFTPGATGNEWFISSDMFYLELLIDAMGVVQEVKIQHDGKTELQNVPEMVDCLRRNDFTDFTEHLEGLVAIYQLNADKKIKSKAFIALQALEADLLALSNTYSHFADGEAIVMKSLFGLFQPRKGGHPVKLVYFISPYEFLDTTTKVTLPSDIQTILDKKLGTTATVSIQASTSRKLQMSTTVSINKTSDGKYIPTYGTLNATNSTALPACFTVNLGKPIPICKDLLMAIQKTTGIHCFDFSNPQPILSLVTQHASNGTLDCTNNRGLFVVLPDTPNTLQVHCYFMTETPNLEGIMVSSVPFTLASQLPQVISILRQQVMFNTIVGSCIRVGSKPDMDCMVFEVNALSHQNVSVSFQHPLEDSLVTLEFDLRDVSHPQCRLHAMTNIADVIPTLEEHACKVVQRSLSIPITVRAVIRRWQTMKSKYEPPNAEFNVPVGGSHPSDSNPNQLGNNELSCGAESERAQNQQQQQQQTSSQQNPVVPGVVMSLNSNNNNNNSSNTTSNIPAANTNNNNNNNSNMNNSTTNNSINSSMMMMSTATTTVNNNNITISNSVSNSNNNNTSGRHPSGSSSSSYTISPINTSNSNFNSNNNNNNNTTGNFSQSQSNQNPMELLSSYPLMSNLMSNQLGGGNVGNNSNLPSNYQNMNTSLTLQNLQNLSGLGLGSNPNMLQMNLAMLNQQMQNSNQKPAMLMGLLDQCGPRGRRRKRKGTSSDSNQNINTNQQQQGSIGNQGNVTNIPRPSPSPSPKSPRMLPNKSPKRRPSEESEASGGDSNSRAPTPQTPLTPRDGNSNSNVAINLLMNEIGLDVPDQRWNIDITPVGGTSSSGNSNSMENFLASKLLSGLGTQATSGGNSNNNNNSMNSSSSNQHTIGNEFQIDIHDSDMEIENTTEGNNTSKFSIPQNTHKKLGGGIGGNNNNNNNSTNNLSGKKTGRDFPKRSMSLDSHHSTTISSLDDHSSANLQSILNQQQSGNDSGSTDFKPLVTPSLSITPVSTNSSMGSSTVNSLLAAMRPGIEIIPLPQVQIPNSITVTPIHPKPMLNDNHNLKKLNSGSNNTNISNQSSLKDKKNEDSSSSQGTNNNNNNNDGSTILKKKSISSSSSTSSSSSSSSLSDSSKKERKRKASSIMPTLLDEDGIPINSDFISNNKQPKLLNSSGSSSVGNVFTSLNEKFGSKQNNSGMSVTKGVSPPFGNLSLKKPGSPSLSSSTHRGPSSKSSSNSSSNSGTSPTPKIGGKPSVSTLKSVSGSPSSKYQDGSSNQQQTSSSGSSSSLSTSSFKNKMMNSGNNSNNNNNKDRKGSFQGNPKIAKNLSVVGLGNPNSVAANLIPSLKALTDNSLPLTLGNLNTNSLGNNSNSGTVVGNLRQDTSITEMSNFMKANLINKGLLEATKQLHQQQIQQQQQQSQVSTALAAQIQRSNSTGGNSNTSTSSSNSGSGGNGGNNNNNPNNNNSSTTKKGLNAIIDKLLTNADDTTKTSSSKDMSQKDYLKASSNITNDVIQITQQGKKPSSSSSSTGNNTNSSSNNNGSSNTNNNNNNNTTSSSGGNNNNNTNQSGNINNTTGGTGGANNPEYMVKPGGQGLKMTLGKTKSSGDVKSKGLNAVKDTLKSSMKALSSKKGITGVKLSSSSSITKIGSNIGGSSSGSSNIGGGINSGNTNLGTNNNSNIKKSNTSGGNSGQNMNIGNKDTNRNTEKDINKDGSSSSSTSNLEKKSSGSSIKSSPGQNSNNSGNGNTGSNSSTKQQPRKEDEVDLTRALFLPGAGMRDTPKFDITKYQIPKKSSSNSNNTTSNSSNIGNPSSTTITTSTTAITTMNSGNINEYSPNNNTSPSNNTLVTSSSSSKSNDATTPTKENILDNKTSNVSSGVSTNTTTSTSTITTSITPGSNIINSNTNIDNTYSSLQEKDKIENNTGNTNNSNNNNKDTSSNNNNSSIKDKSDTTFSSTLVSNQNSLDVAVSSSSSSSNNNNSNTTTSGSSSILMSSATIESSSTTSSSTKQLIGNSNQSSSSSSISSEPTKLIKLSSASIASSENIPFLEEMKKYCSKPTSSFSNSSSASSPTMAGSPMNLSSSTSSNLVSSNAIRNSNNSNNQSNTSSQKVKSSSGSSSTSENQQQASGNISVGEPDSTTNENQSSGNESFVSSNVKSSSKSSEDTKSSTSSSSTPIIIPGLDHTTSTSISNKTIQASPVNVESSNVPVDEFISPESPDPDTGNMGIQAGENIYKNTVTIPTTPKQPISESSLINPNDVTNTSSPALSPDQDQLFIDVPPTDSGNNKKSNTDSSISSASQNNNMSMGSNVAENKDSNTTTINPTTTSFNENNTLLSSSNSSSANTTNPSIVMPPPPVPTTEQPSTTASSTNSTQIPSTTTTTATTSASSLSSSSSSSTTSSSSNNNVPIVSVHIVHSPQPNSPALLQYSPLVVQSPHSSHASPLTVDDDLMDHALLD